MAELDRLITRKPKIKQASRSSKPRYKISQQIAEAPSNRLNVKAPGVYTDRLNESSVDSSKPLQTEAKPVAPRYKPVKSFRNSGATNFTTI